MKKYLSQIKTKYNFWKLYKRNILFIIISFFFISLLFVVDIFFYDDFLKNYIYPFSLSLTAIILTWIAYKDYDRKQPKIHTILWFFHKDDNCIKDMFPNAQSETGFFIWVQIKNNGATIVQPTTIGNDKGELLYFVRQNNNVQKLNNGESHKCMLNLTPQNLQLIRRSSFFYLTEDIEKKKHPILLSPKNLSVWYKRIDDYLAGIK